MGQCREDAKEAEKSHIYGEVRFVVVEEDIILCYNTRANCNCMFRPEASKTRHQRGRYDLN